MYFLNLITFLWPSSKNEQFGNQTLHPVLIQSSSYVICFIVQIQLSHNFLIIKNYQRYTESSAFSRSPYSYFRFSILPLVVLKIKSFPSKKIPSFFSIILARQIKIWFFVLKFAEKIKIISESWRHVKKNEWQTH